MTKSEVWKGLDTGWRKAFRKTVRRWIRHVKAGGKAKVRVGCYLCVERRRRGLSRCGSCPIALELHSSGYMCCETVKAYGDWAVCLATRQSALRPAKRVLRYLLGFLPKGDKLRAQAEELLRKKENKR